MPKSGTGAKYIGTEGRAAFLAEARRCEPLDRRAFLLVLFYFGCRVSEALRLTVNRIDWQKGDIEVDTLKGRGTPKTRFFIIPAELLELLSKVTHHKSPEDRIFAFSRTTGWRCTKHIALAAGIDPALAMPRALRHSFGFNCVERRVPQRVIQAFFGHTDSKTTDIYTDLTRDDLYRWQRRTWPLEVTEDALAKADTITIGRRGTMTLPAGLRRDMALQQGDQLIIVKTDHGLLLKPAVTIAKDDLL